MQTSPAAVTIEFEGHAIGAYVLAGPDAGVLEVSIDGEDYKRVNLYHQYSRGLHYPRTVMFATDLKPGKHTAQIRVALPKEAPPGTAPARILVVYCELIAETSLIPLPECSQCKIAVRWVKPIKSLPK